MKTATEMYQINLDAAKAKKAEKERLEKKIIERRLQWLDTHYRTVQNILECLFGVRAQAEYTYAGINVSAGTVNGESFIDAWNLPTNLEDRAWFTEYLKTDLQSFGYRVHKPYPNQSHYLEVFWSPEE